MREHGSQWFSNKMNDRHPLQLKKSKSWEPFSSYHPDSTANLTHLSDLENERLGQVRNWKN